MIHLLQGRNLYRAQYGRAFGNYRRESVSPNISSLLNDLRALEHEIRATGLAEYAAVVDRAVQELCRVHADAKVAEQIILPGRTDE